VPAHRVLLAGEPVTDLAEYSRRGGGEGLRLAARLGPDGVLDELEISGLRGRGGAGFPTGVKWRSIVAGGSAEGERFVVANGAEGEPGTFKDRYLLRHNPYLLVEGLLIAAQTVGAARAFIALKGSFTAEAERVTAAVQEVGAAGWAPEVQVELVLGPDEYLYGEEKALLEVIEGEDPLPRLFPPYLYGLFTTNPQMGWSAGRTLGEGTNTGSNPTLVNNVETLSTVPLVVREGGEWYRTLGTPDSPGTVICTVSGDTVRHGVDEFEMGTPLAEVIAGVGHGLPAGRAIRYVLSGVANPVLSGDSLDAPVSYEGMEAAGSGLGSAGFMVFDDRTDPTELAAAVSRFLWVESCGQCPPCKLGCESVTTMLEERLSGGGSDEDWVVLRARLGTVTDAARCYLPSQEQRVVRSLLPAVLDPAQRGTLRNLLVTKVVDLDGGRFVLDQRQRYKRPDWTYGDPVTTNPPRLPPQGDSLSETITALRAAGFGADFEIADGAITWRGGAGAGGDGAGAAAPERFVVAGVYRFEGASDPDDEEIVMALRNLDTGAGGVLATAFGPYAGADEADVLRRLPHPGASSQPSA
jgi:NADH-quinone oxidoreductase subunit F